VWHQSLRPYVGVHSISRISTITSTSSPPYGWKCDELSCCKSHLGTIEDQNLDKLRHGTHLSLVGAKNRRNGTRTKTSISAVEGIIPVPNFPGYEVTPDGRVFFRKKNGELREKKLWQNRGGDNVPAVTIRNRVFRISILVCLAFHGPKPSPLHQVRHLDNDPSNNHKDNLAWGTPEQQMEDRRAARTLAGERSGRAKLTDAQVLEIRAHAAGGSPYTEIGKLFGVHANVARQIHLRKLWGHLPDPEDGLPVVTPLQTPKCNAPQIKLADILSQEAIAEIRYKHVKTSISYGQLAREYGVSRMSITRLIKGHR